MKESSIQKTIIEYLTIIASKHKLFFFSIPNESLMTALVSFQVPEKTRYKLVAHYKKLGMISGIPDLCILNQGGESFFIEVKVPGKEPNERQMRIHKKINETGHYVYVASSVEDVEYILFLNGIK